MSNQSIFLTGLSLGFTGVPLTFTGLVRYFRGSGSPVALSLIHISEDVKSVGDLADKIKNGTAVQDLKDDIDKIIRNVTTLR